MVNLGYQLSLSVINLKKDAIAINNKKKSLAD